MNNKNYVKITEKLKWIIVEHRSKTECSGFIPILVKT